MSTGNNLSEFLELAQRIKAKRATKLEPPKPLHPEPFANCSKAFRCRDSKFKQLSVGPTAHSIERFIQRYPYVDRSFYPKSNEHVLNTMREVFNKCWDLTDSVVKERNLKYSKGNNVIMWGNESFAFIVDIKCLTIITSELMGDFARFNKWQ